MTWSPDQKARRIHDEEPGEKTRHQWQGRKTREHSLGPRHLARYLVNDLGDRAGAESQAYDRDDRRIHETAQPCAGDRRQAANSSKPRERAERRALPGDGRDDRQPLGRVVQSEADDEKRPQRRFTQRERGADSQPFTQIMEADPYRDEKRDDGARRRRGGGVSRASVFQPRAHEIKSEPGARVAAMKSESPWNEDGSEDTLSRPS